MYLTTYITPKQIFKQNFNYDNFMQKEIIVIKEYRKLTINIKFPKIKENLTITQQKRIQEIEQTIEIARNLLKPFENNYENEYYTFKIPKHSGGFRTINAPNTAFKNALNNVKTLFENNIRCLPHSAAHAYIKQTSITDALKKHQKNNSNWFLKIDLKNFFPSCKPEHIYNLLINLYPFYYLSENHKILLKEIIQICCLNNGLPQGTPMSPLLTNLIMVHYDYQIEQYLAEKEGFYIFTRYADDLLISSQKKFNWKETCRDLQEILKPFEINKEKIRFGSKAGRNWNLGLMLNKDNKITLGHKKKKTLNAMLNNFLKKYTTNQHWTKEELYKLQGHLSYLNHIEPEYHDYIIKKYNKKYHTDLKTIISNTL